MADPSTSAPISGRLAASCTRCSPAGRRSIAKPSPTRLAAILEREPNWRMLPAATPTSIRRLLQRCLEKDVSRRLRDIGDACLELDDAIGRLGSRSLPGRLFEFGRERRWACRGRDHRGVDRAPGRPALGARGAERQALGELVQPSSRRSRRNQDSSGSRVCRRTASGSYTAATSTAIGTSFSRARPARRRSISRPTRPTMTINRRSRRMASGSPFDRAATAVASSSWAAPGKPSGA